jgi:HK97 family phage prohead protease
MRANFGPLERAMTHDADGRACERPNEVRAMVSRMMAWGGQTEACKSCLAAQAVSVISGEALCARCKSQRDVRVYSADVLDRRAKANVEVVSGEGLRGHAVVFDQWSVDLGGFVERVRSVAVNTTIAQGLDVRGLWNHNSDLPLGRSSARTAAYWKDAAGLAVHIVPPGWAAGHIETVRRGDVTGMSFGFRAIEDEWFMDGPKPKRDLLDMTISEVSAVAFPAYPQTDIAVADSLRAEQPDMIEYRRKWQRTKLAR